MSNDKIGVRIKRLRMVNGLSQADLATRLTIATSTISKIENGRTEPSAEQVAVAAIVLGCTPEFLHDDEPDILITRPWLRAYADASKKLVDQQMADVTLAVEFIERLELRMLPDTIPVMHGDPEDDEDLEQHALDVRAAAQLDEGDVVGNSIRAAERLGCIVLPMGEELGRHLGLSARANGSPVICASRPSHDPARHVPGDRQRFTVAHELGHLSMHTHLGPPQTAEEASIIERQAHRFAGAFLAPAEAMRQELADAGGRVTLKTLSGIKGDWGISIKALVARFQTLGVVDSHQARSLYKQISARGWNKQEPVSVGNEAAVWFSRATKLAERNEGTSPESVGLNPRHIHRWLDWSPSPAQQEDAEVVPIARARRSTQR